MIRQLMTEVEQCPSADVATGKSIQGSWKIDLDRKIIVAHRDRDLPLLATLYERAADLALSEGDCSQGYYFLTQAWIFALDAEMPQANYLCNRLVAAGRAG